MALEIPQPETLPIAASARPGVGFASIALVLVSVAFSIAGQLTLRAAMNRVGFIGRAEVSTPFATATRVAKEPLLWVGLLLFGISAVFWLVVLSRVPLSVAYPFVGLSYILIVAFSRLVLHESIPLLRWVGVIVVAAGIVIVGLSFRRVSGI
jgi:multidrug transporter EmrE-like cation transporter